VNQSYQIHLKARSPLVMHSNTLANPLSEEKKQLSALTLKKPKTDAAYLAIQKIEFSAGIYYDHLLGVYLPTANLRKMLIEGGRKNKKGKAFESGLYVIDDVPVVIDNDASIGKLPLEALFEKYAWTVPVGNQKNTVMRTRPRFDSWECTFSVMIETSLLNVDDIENALNSAGIGVGIGDAKSLGMGRFVGKVLAPVVAK
jgi:hypothetical protein